VATIAHQISESLANLNLGSHIRDAHAEADKFKTRSSDRIRSYYRDKKYI